MTRPQLAEELAKGLSDEEEEVRLRAVVSLSRLDLEPDEAVPLLRMALSDDYEQVRYRAVTALTRWGPNSDEAVEVLREALGSAYGRVRVAAAASLARLEPKADEAIATLGEALSHPDDEVQYEAIGTLANVGQRFTQAIDLLHEALNSKEKTVRYQSAVYLFQQGSESDEVIDVLIEMLQSNEDEVRDQALSSIDSSVEIGQQPPRVVEVLMSALDNDDEEPRYRSAAILSRLGFQSAMIKEMLLEGVQHAERWSTRIACVNALSNSDEYDARTANTLLAGFTDDDSDVRFACAQALAGLGQHRPAATEEVAKMLIDALEDPTYDKLDRFDERTGHDYAFDSLWMLITQEEVDPHWFDPV
jgi:HEAT repeat protein